MLHINVCVCGGRSVMMAVTASINQVSKVKGKGPQRGHSTTKLAIQSG